MYVLVADIERRIPDKIIDDILAYHQKFRIAKFGMEKVQFQEYLADHLKKIGNARGIYPVVEALSQTADKTARIASLQPLVKSGFLQFSMRSHQLLEEMRFFPRGNHDDGLDALEMAVRIARDYGGDDGLISLGPSRDIPDMPYDTGSGPGDGEFNSSSFEAY